MFVSVHEPGQAWKTAATRRYGEERRAQVQKLLLGNAHLVERRGRMGRLATASPHKPFERKRRQTCLGKLRRETGRETIMLLILLLVILLLVVAPAWPHSRRWGYYPSGALGAVLVIVIALVLLGDLRL